MIDRGTTGVRFGGEGDMEGEEFTYPPLDDSSDDETNDGDHYTLDVDAMESPIRTPVIIDTSNSFGSDNQVAILDAPPRQSPDINLYDNLIDECPQESVEVRCEQRETELAECQEVIESLRAQLVAEQRKNKKLSKSLHAALATFRTERNHKERTISELEERSHRLLAVSCPYCERGFDANSASIRRPSPANIRILRGQCVVELKFGDYDSLRSWVLAADLEMNTDGLPTLPDSLANSLLPAKQPQPLSLASAGSRLVRPPEQSSTPDISAAKENPSRRSISTDIPTEVKSCDSPSVSSHISNYRIPKKGPVSPLRSKNDNRAESERRITRRDDTDRLATRHRSRSRSRNKSRRRSRSCSRSRDRKRPRGRMSPLAKRSRSRSRSSSPPRRRSPHRRSPSPKRSKHTKHDRQRRRERHSAQSTNRSSFGRKSPRKRHPSSPKKSLSSVSNVPQQKKARHQKQALVEKRTEAGTSTRGQKLDAANWRPASNASKQMAGLKDSGREKRQRSNTPSGNAAVRPDQQQNQRRSNSRTVTLKETENVDTFDRPSLPITPAPQSPARSTAKQMSDESTVPNLTDSSDEPPLDRDFIREALRAVQDLSPHLSPVKPLTPRTNTPLRLAVTPCARAASSSAPPKERRTVTPLKISVVRPRSAGKGRISGKLAAMLLMKLEDEAKQLSDGEITSDDEAADENDATTTPVDSCAPILRQSAAPDRTNIWMNSLRKNLHL